jgi:hypothetical protein
MYAVEMGSGGMIYILFHKDWFRHSRVVMGDTLTVTQTHRQQDDIISLLLFF